MALGNILSRDGPESIYTDTICTHIMISDASTPMYLLLIISVHISSIGMGTTTAFIITLFIQFQKFARRTPDVCGSI